MSMPPTHYDLVRKCRPFVIDLAEQDAADLLKNAGPSPIHSVDDYDSRFRQCVDQMDQELIARTAQMCGFGIEEIERHFPEHRKNAAYVAMLGTVNFEYHCLVNFALAGKKTFYFSDNLSEHLAHTEINMKAALVEMPFPSCLFVFTSRDVLNAMYNLRGEEGRRAMNAGGVDYSAPISVFLTLLPAYDGLPGRKLMVNAFHSRPPAKAYQFFKRELYLGEDWTLEQALRTDWEQLLPNKRGPGIKIDTHADTVEHQDDKTFYTDGLMFYRIILNAVLYLASDQSELVHRESERANAEARAKALLSAPKRKKALQKSAHHSVLDYAEAGPSVGTIVIQPGAAESTGGGAGDRKLNVRFMVRGHWRQQAHGPGGQARKLIWIRPFYKGPDVAALINKPYVVRGAP